MARWILLVAMALSLVAGDIRAQGAWPEKPVHVLVGFLPGSPPDVFARLFALSLGAASRRPVLVENVTGAAGSLAAERLANATPDGSTLAVLTEAQLLANPHLYALAYRPADLAPVSQLFTSPNLLVVGASSPAIDVRSLVEQARQSPGGLTFASGGNGTTAHLAGEMFRSQAAVDIRHVPYRGLLAALPDVAAGRVTMAFSPAGIVLPLVRQGKLRALAITSAHRVPYVPDVPTMAETGYPGVEISGWAGLLHARGLRRP
jgi:tripartite-type tricarboxylate transporter receptor subunit TctC